MKDKKQKETDHLLYNWLWFYNSYEKLWYAFKREDYNKFFNGELRVEEYCKATNPNHIIEFLSAKKEK